MQATIKAIEYYLPDAVLTNDELVQQFPEWSSEKIAAKTGILRRHIAAPTECASDLAVRAGERLFSTGACSPEDIDYILLCTQSPDYFLPTTACLVQGRLGVPTSSGALDINLGCSGFVYGLGLAKGLIETGQAQNILLITTETYSKFLNPEDKSLRVLFGDGAAATLVTGLDSDRTLVGPFVWGTDGRGKKNLIVEAGGLRHRTENGPLLDEATTCYLSMNGPEIFTFTLRVVPQSVAKLLSQAHLELDDIDLFVFHQANKYMLDHLRNKLGISPSKFFLNLANVGNTVSSTIPIALKDAHNMGQLTQNAKVMILGFGVGYSWAGALLEWNGI